MRGLLGLDQLLCQEKRSYVTK